VNAPHAPLVDLATRVEIADLYAAYAACLDNGDYSNWPEFFTEDCVYKVLPRENHDRGLPLATLAFESRGMLKDRVYGATQTLFHQPYYQRHLIGPARITAVEGDAIATEANYLVVRTKKNEPSEVYNCGRYVDRIVRDGARLLFAQKLCVFDSELIPNSIIYPL
jgi:salicylate 5-hydroxylase small subunit